VSAQPPERGRKNPAAEKRPWTGSCYGHQPVKYQRVVRLY